MAIKAVFFDAAGTLIKPARRVGESYAVVAKKFGVAVSPPQLSERFRVCFDASSPLAFPGAPATAINRLERDWWKRLVRKIFEPWEPFERFDDYFTELFDYFARPDAWALFPEVLETLSALRGRGLILSVISNFDSRLIGILNGLGAGQWFDEIVISSRAGHAKPDRRIFAAALARHSLEPNNAAHIGDSEEKDLCGANDAGLKGILVDRNDECPSAAGPRVANLKEILALLDD
jgi:putative hydrolase of the HAD superfamily